MKTDPNSVIYVLRHDPTGTLAPGEFRIATCQLRSDLAMEVYVDGTRFGVCGRGNSIEYTVRGNRLTTRTGREARRLSRARAHRALGKA